MVWTAEGTLWKVKLDPSQADQLVTNLALNARDAIDDVGRITLSTSNVVIGERDDVTRAGGAPGEYVMLEVTDTGRGIDEDDLPVIFEPFFTTKERGKGTGLGLATVLGIVKQNGGFIDVKSARGGRQHVSGVPASARGRHTTREGRAVLSEPARGTETILIVEDELPILRMAEEVLTRYGYTRARRPGAVGGPAIARPV